MKLIDGLIGGLAGAISITLIHEITRKLYAGAPRLDLLGEQAAQKVMKKTTGNEQPKEDLYGPALAGDLIANALYYGLAASGTKHPIKSAGLLGFSAGLGAITLPSKMGLREEFVSGTLQKKLITVGLYTLGGIIAGGVVNLVRSGEVKRAR